MYYTHNIKIVLLGWDLLGVDTGEESEKMDASKRALISTLAMLD